MEKRNSLKKSVVINIAGSALPLFISIVTVPIYLNSIGATRYGILALVWLFVGYFNLLDFGISRATVNQISKIDKDDVLLRQQIFWSAIWINITIGVIGMCAAYPVAHYVFGLIKFEDHAIRLELLKAIPWLCLTVPLTVGSAVGLGALEARERFDLANLVQIFGSLTTQIIPVFVARWISTSLDVLILSIVIAKIAAFVYLFILLKKSFPLHGFMKWNRSAIRNLVTYGGWASISGIISPLLEALDRFIIGAKLTAGDVALYSVPFSIADKLRIIPRALARAAFPKLSSLPHEEALTLYQKLINGSIVLMTPLILFVIFGSKYLLFWWIGAPHDGPSPVIAIILFCGAWFNSIGVIPFVYMQARGKPNVTAKIHMLEFVPFVIALFYLIEHFGVIGAALAWSARMIADCALLCFVAKIDSRTTRNLCLNALILVFSAWYMVFHDLSLINISIIILIITIIYYGINFSLIKSLLTRRSS